MQVLSRSAVLEPYRAQRVTKDSRSVAVWLTATALVNEAGETYAIATTARVVDAARPDEGR
jgi:two-component system CheB/CheR fusion protein